MLNVHYVLICVFLVVQTVSDFVWYRLNKFAAEINTYLKCYVNVYVLYVYMCNDHLRHKVIYI